MRSNPNRSGTLAEQAGDCLHVQAGNDPQGDRLGLVAGQGRDERERTFGVDALQYRSSGVVPAWAIEFGDVVGQSHRRPARAAPGVDGPATAERAQPAAKGGLVAGEVDEATRDVDPHVGGDVLGSRRVVKKYAKVTKQRRMGVTPQHGERHLVATGRSVEHDPELVLEHERHVTRTRRCASVNSTDAHRLSY